MNDKIRISPQLRAIWKKVTPCNRISQGILEVILVGRLQWLYLSISTRVP